MHMLRGMYKKPCQIWLYSWQSMLVLTAPSCTQELHHGDPAVFLPTADTASLVVAMPLHIPSRCLKLIV